MNSLSRVYKLLTSFRSAPWKNSSPHFNQHFISLVSQCFIFLGTINQSRVPTKLGGKSVLQTHPPIAALIVPPTPPPKMSHVFDQPSFYPTPDLTQQQYPDPSFYSPYPHQGYAYSPSTNTDFSISYGPEGGGFAMSSGGSRSSQSSNTSAISPMMSSTATYSPSETDYPNYFADQTYPNPPIEVSIGPPVIKHAHKQSNKAKSHSR